MRCFPLAVAVVVLVCPGVLAQGTFPLTYEEGGDAASQVLTTAWVSGRRSAERPESLRGIPSDLPAETVYYQVVFGDVARWAVIAPGKPATLYFDTDADGDLADEQPVSSAADGGGIGWAGLAVRGAGAAPVRLYALSHSGADGHAPRCLHVRPGGCRAGTVELAGRRYRLALIDGNFNGRYDDTLTAPLAERGADGLAIDLNGDGLFQRADYRAGTTEWMPLCKGVPVNGTYYALRAAPDGSQVHLTPTTPAMGTLDLGERTVEFQAFTDYGFVSVRTADGRAELPAGLCTVVALKLLRTDKDGGVWAMDRRSGDDPLGRLTIPAGKRVEVPLGPPLVCKTDVRQSGRQVFIGLTLVGRAGEQYVSRATRVGAASVRPPSLKVLDEAGNVLATGTFEYG
jgi:hypothetical protein